jgi:hypothetical protein
MTQNNVHKFNNDLLANDGDLKVVHELYGKLEHVLHNPDLIKYFKTYNDPAGTAKTTSTRWGTWAIVLGATALFLAAIDIGKEQLFADNGKEQLLPTMVLGIFPALCGLISVAIGAFSVLFGSRKQKWLYNRFMGERIRQFHFQSLIAGLPQIFDSLPNEHDNLEESKSKIERFETYRHQLLIHFKNNFDGNVASKFSRLISDSGKDDFWLDETLHETQFARLHEPHFAISLSELRQDLDMYFKAYRELRIMHQLDYAYYKLQSDHKIFSAMPLRQAEVLENINKAGIAWLFLIHFSVIMVAILFVVGVAPAKAISLIFSIAIIVIAILGLSTRAFQQGLQPEREIERYQQYGSQVQSALEQFDGAETLAQKIGVMLQLERYAFNEMRNFLLTYNRSSFTM